jgi:Mn-dependent DtxR family transcriptional regulator
VTFPQDTTMLALVAHAAGDSFAVAPDGELALTVRSEERLLPFDPEALDALESRGWVEVTVAGRTVITEKGRYAARRWLEQRLGKGRLARTHGLRVTGVHTGEVAGG